MAACILAWISTGFTGLEGWFSFFVVIVLAAGGLAGLFRLLRLEDPPGWLARLTVGAAVLRLAAGIAWFILLPVHGYDTDVQNAGYVMEDAFHRDAAAWELASSGFPLWGAFRETDLGNLRGTDQYGGYLFLSAAVYRYSGAVIHQPLLVVLMSAAISALAIPLGWAAARRLFGERTAVWTAWGLALYPEAVLLGSSQMREGLAMPLVAAAVYGAIVFQARSNPGRRAGMLWMTVPLVLLLPISPPFSGILIVLLGLIGLGLDDWRVLRSWRLWLVLGGLAVLVVGALYLGWEAIAPRLDVEEFASPLDMARTWFELSARWQARQTEDTSGWLQRIFEDTPEWFRLPFLVLYGVSRPLLPAQLAAFSIPVWWAIGVWRALGWTLLLIPLLVAPLLALRSPDRRGVITGLIAAAWLSIMIASFWGGGDMWDNPRYRVAFVAVQLILAARVVIVQLETPDPWLRRAVIVALAVPVWFMFWYLRRYTAFDQVVGWTVIDVFKVLGAGVYTGILLAVWDWAKEN
ncbi:MAG TPA: hypothetical protein VMN57_00070 [Anaerolineales bacterium]|nr:hypothetical protein [Anaerolineales bacterium]